MFRMGQYVDWTKLHAYSEGDRAFEASVIAAFRQSTQEQCSRINHALLTEDFGSLARAIHQLKGSSGNMGAAALYEQSITYEQAIAQADLYKCRQQFIEIEQILAETYAEFNRQGF